MAPSSAAADSDTEDEIQVESLVAGRQRRQNAGNRMATLIATEETIETPNDEDDELKLLFEENAAEEDAEFASGDDAVSDVELDTSSEDEDANGDDEDAGEKELERQAKEARKRKRKAMDFTTNKKRKMELKPATKQPGTQPRPKKKSERVSWLPTAEEGPTRASTRTQTVQNKQVIYERMKESEIRTEKTRKQMEAAAKRKEAENSVVLTQADRLAEAAQVEARNAKTLNRWQIAEEKRVAEQKAKLNALKNRTLTGPVLSIWSGPSKVVDGKVVSYGRDTIEVETSSANVPPAKAIVQTFSRTIPRSSTMSTTQVFQNINGSWNSPRSTNPFQFGFVRSQLPARPVPDAASFGPPVQDVKIESRTLVILNEAACEEPEIRTSMLLKPQKSSIKTSSKMPEKDRCLITGQYARYRDPKTGIPYASLAAFKQLRISQSSGTFVNGRWSTLLGQYVGSDAEAPTGVPGILRAVR